MICACHYLPPSECPNKDPFKNILMGEFMKKDDLGINVLSLFDGMSCGMIALEKVGVKVDNYYASEIKQSAIKCTKKELP